MIDITIKVPEDRVGEFYELVGRWLAGAPLVAHDADSAIERIERWANTPEDLELAKQVWSKFSPPAKAMFNTLMDAPGRKFTGEEGRPTCWTSRTACTASLESWPGQVGTDEQSAVPCRPTGKTRKLLDGARGRPTVRPGAVTVPHRGQHEGRGVHTTPFLAFPDRGARGVTTASEIPGTSKHPLENERQLQHRLIDPSTLAVDPLLKRVSAGRICAGAPTQTTGQRRLPFRPLRQSDGERDAVRRGRRRWRSGPRDGSGSVRPRRRVGREDPASGRRDHQREARPRRRRGAQGSPRLTRRRRLASRLPVGGR